MPRKPKVPETQELFGSKAARDKLTIPQLADFVSRVEALTKGMGGAKLPQKVTDFAQKYSRGRWVHAPHLDLVGTKLERLKRRELKGLIVSMPPRHGKSTLICENLPAWWLGDAPTEKVILAGYGERFAKKWGGAVRDLILEHQDEFNLRIRPDRIAEDDWQLTMGGGMVSTGVGGSLTGRGAHLLIIDDPIKNEEEAFSEVYRERMWNWWQATASTRLEPRGVVVIVLTRWHEDDIAGRLENDLPEGWEVLKLAALAEKDDPLARELGEPLWPERFPDDPLYERRQKGISPYWFSALFQQRPTPEGGGKLKEAWLRQYHQLPSDIDAWCQTWDLSLKDKPTSDPAAGQVWARKGADHFLVDGVVGHFSLDQVISHMRAFQMKYPKAIAKLVEDTAMGPILKASVKHQISGVMPITPKGSKLARVEAVIPLWAAGNVYVPVNELNVYPPWVKKFVGECTSFPKGTHDDQVDAMTQGLSYLEPGAWREAKRAAREIEEQAKEITPLEAQRILLHERFEKANKRSARQHNPPSRARRMW